MTTPLEDYILKLNASKKILLIDRQRLAIGTDMYTEKGPVSPLLDGVKKLSCAKIAAHNIDEAIENDWTILPLTYSFSRVERKETGKDYDREANIHWVNTVLNKPAKDGGVTTCHVFHPKIAAALKAGRNFKNNLITEEEFRKSFREQKGNEDGASFAEVIAVLKAGFRDVGDVNVEGHVMLALHNNAAE